MAGDSIQLHAHDMEIDALEEDRLLQTSLERKSKQLFCVTITVY